MAVHAPSPRLVGVAALAATSAYLGPAELITAGWYGCVGLVVWFVLVAAAVVLVSRCSRQAGVGSSAPPRARHPS